MPRVKGGYTTRHRRKKVLKQAKGYFGAKHLLYRTAKEQVMHSLAYSYRDRKNRKREFRKLWITRINAAVREENMTYSQFMYGLKILLSNLDQEKNNLIVDINKPDVETNALFVSEKKEEDNNLLEKMIFNRKTIQKIAYEHKEYFKRIVIMVKNILANQAPKPKINKNNL